MKKYKILLSAAAAMLVFSTVGSTRAALTYYSDNYAADVTVSSIGVSLVENGNTVSYRNYNHKNDEWSEATGTLLESLQGDEKLVLGKVYDESISVTNSGSIDSYVRVILNKSWVKGPDKDSEKDTTLSPDLIDLNLITGNGWVIDESASTPERTVLYYTNILPAGASTPPLSDTLRIDPSIAKKVTEKKDENGVITTTFDYDGYRFNVEAEVDAVQTHNAADAIKSAWGVDAGIIGLR
ncbi:MAG: hypothetical protein KH828_05910 [Clostridiales bacterium]|nr:hypothetical protein [Clostridiales bacterium]